jgi:hypothetical protein
MNPFDKAWDLLKFQNLQSELEMGYDDPRYEKAIGLTYAPTANSPAKPSINLAQRNPARTAPKDAFFNTDDVNELARRLSLIDAHEAMGHGEDPMLGHLLNLREHIRHNMPDEQPDKNRMLSQLSAAIEAPGITMEELVNESINPRVSDKSLSERVRDNFAERAGEPGAMFGGGQDTMSAEDARADMGIAESVRSQIGAGYGMPPYSTFGKAWDFLKEDSTDPMSELDLSPYPVDSHSFVERPYGLMSNQAVTMLAYAQFNRRRSKPRKSRILRSHD